MSRHTLVDRTTWEPGPIGDIVDLSFRERLCQFICDGESEPLALFSPGVRQFAKSGDWYGEHVGKWLVSTAAALQRTRSEELKATVVGVIDFLESSQESNGYLGSYAPDSEARFTDPDAPQNRTWDLWIHAWLVLGLLAHGENGTARKIAVRIGELWVKTFLETDNSVLDQGNHAGLSSAVILEPLAKLAQATGDPRYLRLAKKVLADMEERGLKLLDPNPDVATLGTGKVYQILWVIQGLVALYNMDPEPSWLKAAEALYEDIRLHHLTPLGGPWGGIAGHKEVFNARGFFSPEAFVETCSIATWLSLSRELFLLCGREIYASEFERSFLNSLLGAIDANGRDWCYFTFPNGRRNNTYHWACCKSSGAMALEEAAKMVVTGCEDGLSVNLLLPSRSTATVGELPVAVEQRDGEIELKLTQPLEITLRLRTPTGTTFSTLCLNGEPIESQDALRRVWQDGDLVTYALDAEVQVHPFTYTVDHHGQEVVHEEYAYVSRGPWIYATGLVDGYRKSETFRLPQLFPTSPFQLSSDQGIFGPAIDLRLPGERSVRFLTYAEAGGRHDSAWRSTWVAVAWQ